jgi:tRNA A-37 threonylcarbamoyl transferase component Bud32/tetratricopeptide (TPR) repeat protein
MHVVCPNCHGLIEAVTDSGGESCTCPACGCPFALGAAATLVAAPEGTAAAPAASLVLECQTIGRFEIQCEVGRGGYGTVFKAYDSELRRMVALKIPRDGRSGSRVEHERFLREARNASRLHHAAIVPVFDIGESGGVSYIVSEFVEGSTLAALLPNLKFSFRKVAELVACVADGLQCAHENGVVHRDIKPSNIIVDSAGRPRLMDFGMALQARGDATLTLDGEILGTPAYMSPEQASGMSHRVDRRSDIYGLGTIFYELLTGERPFRGNAQMVIHQVLTDEPHNPRSLNNYIPADLETICLKAIDKDPERRYQSAGELADDLRRWLRSEPIRARRVGTLGRIHRWCRRNPALASMTVLALLLVVAVAVGSTAGAMRIASIRQQERQAYAAADGSLQDARRAFDQYYALISDNPLLDSPSTQPLLREILKTAIDHCQGFLAHYGDKPQLVCEVGATYIRLAQLQLASGDTEAAIASTEQGVDRLERVLAGRPGLEQLGPLTAGLFRFPQYAQGRGAAPPADPRRSVATMTRCVAVWDRLAREHPGTPVFDHDRAGMYYYLDLSCRAAGDRPGSQRAIGKSIEILTQLVAQYPDDPAYRRELSQFYSVSGDVDVILGDDLANGLKRHERAAAIDPSNPRPLARMAWILTTYHDPRQRDPLRAAELAAQAIAIEPRNPQHWRALGLAQYRSGNWAESLHSFEKSMVLQSGGEGLDWYLAAMAHWQLGDKARAGDFYRQGETWKQREGVASIDLEGIDREAAGLVEGAATTAGGNFPEPPPPPTSLPASKRHPD